MEDISEKCNSVKSIDVISIVAFKPVTLNVSLNNMPRKAISSNKAGKTPMERMEKNKGAGESK